MASLRAGVLRGYTPERVRAAPEADDCDLNNLNIFCGKVLIII